MWDAISRTISAESGFLLLLAPSAPYASDIFSDARQYRLQFWQCFVEMAEFLFKRSSTDQAVSFGYG